MLIISRRKGQRIVVGNDLEVVITELSRSTVKIGIVAPSRTIVMRGEVRDSIEEENRRAALASLEDTAALDGVTGPSPASEARRTERQRPDDEARRRAGKPLPGIEIIRRRRTP